MDMIALKYVSMATIDDYDYFVIDVQEYIDENVVSSKLLRKTY